MWNSLPQLIITSNLNAIYQYIWFELYELIDEFTAIVCCNDKVHAPFWILIILSVLSSVPRSQHFLMKRHNAGISS